MLNQSNSMEINLDLANLEDLKKLQAIAMAFTSGSTGVHSSAANSGLQPMYNQSYNITDITEENLMYMAKRNFGKGSVFYKIDCKMKCATLDG